MLTPLTLCSRAVFSALISALYSAILFVASPIGSEMVIFLSPIFRTAPIPAGPGFPLDAPSE